MKGRIRSGMITIHSPVERPLPTLPCKVAVTLVSDNTTLFSENYQFDWKEDGTMEFKEIE
jgi:hypothetical protein